MNVPAILEHIRSLRVLVAGDVCLDRWCRYDPALAEPSRETGIPRIAAVATEVTPGAAGTVANNLAALGAGRVDVLGVIGEDGFGYELRRALEARGIGTELLLTADVPTFTYTKLLNCRTGEEDLPRLDFINTRPPAAEVEREFVKRLERAAVGYDAILISDQAETETGGVITAAVRNAVTRAAAAHPEAVVWVDSRMRAEHFRGVIVKPNRREAEEASRRALGRVDFPALREHLEAPLLIVTHGSEGAELIGPTGTRWAAARRVERPVDICGAGDSFSAGAALALRVTGDAMAAAEFGNLVASITIMKRGTGTASPEELLAKC
ncbi:MAG TPA: PfkB family carbohydrate kinase [Bryobacteraceae bacterium]|jgi:rfaE bifunctional protein kinase chain/domain|nr:PfkB family carbohydrate kinase [Bryobacteraceae bacterium]